MSQVTAEDLRNMKPLRTANHTIGNPDATMEMMREDGYLFFRDVLDRAAIERIKRKYMDVLFDMGVVDRAQEEPIWNGVDLSNFPVKIEPLHEARLWEDFVAEPEIDAFFTKLLGSQPFWLPVVEYRMTPPSETLPEDPFVGRHQDKFYNMGMEFINCWVPLMEIDERVGGLAIIPGLHTSGFFHDLSSPPQYRIPPDALPAEKWHRSLYRPGDLILFDNMTPHSGLPNTSDRFRLSMDIRLVPSTEARPVLGEVTQFTDAAITIREQSGEDVTLALDENTYCRWTAGKRLSPAELRAQMPEGSQVLASGRDGKAVLIRPPR
jgi:ectoine hydroxylase-related dioxygenase (phytanoyl-CoA dioxygenase family)